ncbi:DUF6264 family protein [Salinibacterium sp. ZJ454]|uniref:DUF6264 family protein n=1 Tax=Salinibacterium sp. ZJ454 TaxID=2708339 RepID=UPI00141EAEAE|nr:DUF6264 family protein [Salinibacterium sp. ZJ454]
MTEPAAQPQYGAYATPEQQAKARGIAPPPEVVQPMLAAPVEARPKRQVDRIVSMVLLAIGFVNVTTSIPSWLNLPSTLQLAYDQLGIGTYTATALADSLGVVAIVVQAAIWVAALAITVPLIRSNRLSWWVPLVAGAVAFLAVMVIVYIAMAGDPAFVANLTTAG